MPTSSKKRSNGKGKEAPQRRSAKRTAEKIVPVVTPSQGWWRRSFTRLRARRDAFLARRPHRSFRLTRRRDYVRPVKLPNVFAFTAYVSKTLWQNRRLFVPLVLIYGLFYIVLVGLISQDTYTSLSSTLQQTGGGNWGAVSQAGLLLVSIVTPSSSSTGAEASQVFAGLLLLLLWLTTVWLLRNRLAGHKVRLRDGLYNSGAPLFATVIVAFIIVLQLIPLALAALAYIAAASSGLLDSGVAAMLFWLGAALLVTLSLYWITSSLLAMVVVTLPGMYPYRAIRTAGDIVLGRRVKLLLRWLYMLLVVGVAWVVVMIPLVLLESWLRSLWSGMNNIPFIPVMIVIMSAVSVIWLTAYVYLLYRKVVDDA